MPSFKLPSSRCSKPIPNTAITLRAKSSTTCVQSGSFAARESSNFSPSNHEANRPIRGSSSQHFITGACCMHVETPKKRGFGVLLAAFQPPQPGNDLPAWPVFGRKRLYLNAKRAVLPVSDMRKGQKPVFRIALRAFRFTIHPRLVSWERVTSNLQSKPRAASDIRCAAVDCIQSLAHVAATLHKSQRWRSRRSMSTWKNEADTFTDCERRLYFGSQQ